MPDIHFIETDGNKSNYKITLDEDILKIEGRNYGNNLYEDIITFEIIANGGDVTIESLKGDDYGFVCSSPEGKIIRSNISCDKLNE